MRIRQIKGVQLVAVGSRHRLETIYFQNLEQARTEIQSLFPYHLVCREQGRISVELKDRSFQVAAFQEVKDSSRGSFRR